MIPAFVFVVALFAPAYVYAEAKDRIDKRLNVIEQRLDAQRSFEEKRRRDQITNPGSGWQRQPDGKFLYQDPRR